MSSRSIKIFGGIILGIIFIIGVIFIIVPLIVSATNSPQIKAANETNAQLQQQLQQLNGIQSQSKSLTSIRTKLEAEFPNTANVPDLINLISLAATNAGIPATNISSFNFSAPVLGTPAPGASGAAVAPAAPASAAPGATTAPGAAVPTSQYASLGISLSVKGTSSQFAKFMQTLTSVRRIFTISNFSISGSGDQANLSIAGTTYIYRAIPTPGASASSATASVATPATP